jgi:hypothetical protein
LFSEKISQNQKSPNSGLEAFLSARWDLSASIRALARRLLLRFCRRSFSIVDISAATWPVCFPSILSSNIRRANEALELARQDFVDGLLSDAFSKRCL